MKKFLLTLLVLTMLGVTRVGAQTFEVDGLSYTVLSAADKTVELVKKTPAYAIANVTVPATVTNSGITYTVTSIGQQAFLSNATLESIVLPSGLQTIRKQAFQSCSKLTSVDMSSCTALTEIGENGFFSASKITSLVIPNSCTSIGKWGLRGMSALVSLTLPESLLRVADGLCWGDTKLKGITIPDNVSYIGENAFASCSGLDSIQLGSAVDTLANKAFAYCSQVKKLICRAAVPPVCMDDKSIGSIKTTTPLWVREASLAAYMATAPWSSFTTILPYDPSGSLEDQYFVVAGVGYEMLSADDKTVGVAHIDTLTYAGQVIVRSTVNYAGEDFNVIAVQPGAFKNATALTQLELPASIATFGSEALAGCSSLAYLIMKTEAVPTTGANALSGINFSNCTLYVPPTAAAAFKSADQWKEFTKRSLVIDEVTIDGHTYKCNDVINGTLDFLKCNSYSGALVIPDEVLIEGYPFYVTNIAGNAFYNTHITALTLPSTLKSISGSAFFSLGEYNNPIEKIVVPEGVTTIGNNAFYGCHVNYVELPKHSLTNLAGSAFYSSSIKGIEIPGSVGIIRESTFYGADLQWVVLGEGITEIADNAFFATDLGALTLPKTLQKLGPSAFSGCSGLSSLTFYDGITTVDPSAFSNCTSLFKIFCFANSNPTQLETALADAAGRLVLPRTTYSVCNLPVGAGYGDVIERSDLNTMFDYKGVKYLSSTPGATSLMAVSATYGVDDETVELPQSFSHDGKNYTVSYVAPCVLSGQTVMKSLNVGYPLTAVPDGFVYNASNLKSVTVPATVTKIGAYAFANTDSLGQINLPDGLMEIGLAAFYYSGLEDLVIPGKVILLDNASFAGCRRLKEVTFLDGDDQVIIGYFPTMFGNRPLFTSSPLQKVTIGRNLQTFNSAAYGYSPFAGDSIITDVVFTDKPTSISNNLFRDCKSILNVTMGNGMQSIGTSAFEGCAALDSVYMGNGMRSIGMTAFAGCTSMTKLYCCAWAAPTCSSLALTDINKQLCTLYVPNNRIDEYKAAAQWKDFYNITGFNGVGSIADDVNGHYVVYTLNGIKVLDTTDSNLVDSLPAGIYIVNGKKVYLSK